jgi:hypothetical protein
MATLRTSTQTLGLAAPAIVMAGYLVRPYVRDYLDTTSLATSIAENSERWIASAVLVPAGYAGVALAMHSLAPRGLAAAAMALSSALLGVQLGSIVGAASSAPSAGAATAALETVRGWEGPLIAAVLTLFAVAWLSFVRHSRASLVPGWRRLAFIGAGAVALGGLLVPSSAGELLSAGGAAGALWAAQWARSQPAAARTVA